MTETYYEDSDLQLKHELNQTSMLHAETNRTLCCPIQSVIILRMTQIGQPRFC